MKLLVREASVGDVKAISSIGVISWQAAYRRIVPDEYLDVAPDAIHIALFSRALVSQ